MVSVNVGIPGEPWTNFRDPSGQPRSGPPRAAARAHLAQHILYDKSSTLNLWHTGPANISGVLHIPSNIILSRLLLAIKHPVQPSDQSPAVRHAFAPQRWSVAPTSLVAASKMMAGYVESPLIKPIHAMSSSRQEGIFSSGRLLSGINLVSPVDSRTERQPRTTDCLQVR